MRRAVLALFGGLVAGAAACTLLVDTKDLSGEAGPGPGPDGATSPSEAGPSASSGADGGDARADGPPARFCDAHKDAILCEDFDGPSLAPERIVARLGNVVVTPSSDARSAPNELVVTMPALTGSYAGTACYTSPDIPTTKFHVSFDVLVVTGTSVVVLDVEAIDSAGDDLQGALMGDSTFALFQEFTQFVDGGQATAKNINLPVSFTPAWHHVDVCYDYGSGVRLASFDGARSLSGTGVRGWPSEARVEIGAEYATNNPREEVHIDNVLVDTAACP
jgi:hypothetical protein